MSLLKILAERRSTNLHIWSLLQHDLTCLVKTNPHTFSLNELSQIFDCYYKCTIATREHNQAVALAMLEAFTLEDMLRDLTVNEVLRLFRGLFMMDAIPNSVQY